MSEIPGITTIINPGSEIVSTYDQAPTTVASQLNAGNEVVTTHNSVPQLLTVIQPDKTALVTVIQGNWDVVWSVNGQTGDVLIDVVLSEFLANTTYTKNAAVKYNNIIYTAKATFTSGTTFDASDWDAVTVLGRTAVEAFTANHAYAQDEMIRESGKLYVAKVAFTSGATFDEDDWYSVGGGESTWGDIVGTLADQTDLQAELDAKVDTETGKGLSTNDYTNADKAKLEGLVVNDATLTIQRNGTDIQTFSANASSNATVNIVVPTKTSDISNDSDFQTSSNVATAISTHNSDNTAHSDIRTILETKASTTDLTNLTTRVTTAESDIDGVEEKIPTQASSSNQLADKNFVNSSINSVTAYYVTKNADGDPFSTKAELNAATTFYSGGEVRVPTRNDYCVVLADESRTDPVTGETPTTRYIYQTSQWEFQYIVNKTALTAAQLAAINSNITAEGVAKLNGIAAGAEVNVQTDWDQTDNTADDYLKNRPANLAYIDATGTSATPTPWVSASDIIWSSIIDKIYPIGSIFMSATLSTASDVASALGGTWIAWGAGRVPVGVDDSDTDFDTAEETGGEKTHTLTTSEMPSHSHVYGEGDGNVVHGGSTGSNANITLGGDNWRYTNYPSTQSTGGGSAHNNLQPYITCYMFKRTA